MLRLDDVHFAYRGRPVLRGLSLHARRGEVLALLGRTGSGKTTALRLLAGLERPDRGRVLLDDRTVAGDGFRFSRPRSRDVAVVFQGLALWPHMTVEESLRFVAAGRAASGGGSLQAERDGILQSLGIAGLAGRRPAELSGGEAALAAVARALAQGPRALLMDEPFSGLDADRRAAVRGRVFAAVRSRGLTALHITHQREEALASADRLAVLSGGSIVQCATPAEVYARPATAEAARLTGDAGLIEAEITVANVVTPAGAFPRSTASAAERLGTGWKGLAVLRPESLALAGDGRVEGLVESCEPLGGRWRLTVRFAGRPAAGVPVDSPRSIAAGAVVRLELRSDLPLVEAAPAE